MRHRILTDLFRQKCVCKTLKYTKYSCGFTPFSEEEISRQTLSPICAVLPYNFFSKNRKNRLQLDLDSGIILAGAPIGLSAIIYGEEVQLDG